MHPRAAWCAPGLCTTHVVLKHRVNRVGPTGLQTVATMNRFTENDKIGRGILRLPIEGIDGNVIARPLRADVAIDRECYGVRPGAQRPRVVHHLRP